MRNNRGFTIIEMIIAISILTVVLFMGYMIMNKNNESINANMINTQGQLSVNLVNKYLTKDLERTKYSNITNPSQEEIDNGMYSYKLKTNGFVESNEKLEYITYNVIIDNNKYSITRNTFLNQTDMNNNLSQTSIDIIQNQPMDDNDSMPFYINTNGDDIYTVGMQYKQKSSKHYTFDVNYRYNEVIVVEGDGTPENPLPPPEEPEIDEELQGSKGLNGFIRFGYKDNNAYTSIGSSNVTNNEYKEYDRLEIENNQSEYNIRGLLSFNNNNGHCTTNIGNNSNELNVSQKKDFGMLDVNQINVTILGDAKLELVIKQKDSGNESSWPVLYNVKLDKVGKYLFPINSSGKDILITGKLIVPQGTNYGEAVITFGKKEAN